MALYIADESFDRGVLAGASCAFGVFDGLHTGHQYLIDQAVVTRPAGKRAIAITFDIDPDEVFHPDRLKKLMRNADRIAVVNDRHIEEMGSREELLRLDGAYAALERAQGLT